VNGACLGKGESLGSLHRPACLMQGGSGPAKGSPERCSASSQAAAYGLRLHLSGQHVLSQVATLPKNRNHVLIRQVDDLDLSLYGEADRREVDPPIEVEAAAWSGGGQLEWWGRLTSRVLLWGLSFHSIKPSFTTL
jgi:hypothetical protein